MDKVFEIRICSSGLGRYNATRISTFYVVSDSSDKVISNFLSDDTISVEILSANPVLIIK